MANSRDNSYPVVDPRLFEAHSRQHRSPSCATCKHFWYMELRQTLNGTKLRIRNVPRIPKEQTTVVAFHLLDSRQQSTMLRTGDVLRARREKGWDGVADPEDIVVTFATAEKRDVVYGRRKFIETRGDRIQILDELIPEKAAVWKEAVKYFGDARVDTAFGSVKICTCDSRKHYVHTMGHLKALIADEERKMFAWLLSDLTPPPRKKET